MGCIASCVHGEMSVDGMVWSGSLCPAPVSCVCVFAIGPRELGDAVPRDLVELKKTVKAASDIVDVVSNYVPVITVGKTYKSICPFHNDTRPSMQIDRKWQNFHCWACGAKGDVFTFVEKYEKVNFMESLSILARRANIPLEEASPQDQHKLQLFETMRWAQLLYQECLLENEIAVPARSYLGTRHLAGATVRQFGLGFARIDGDWLVQQATAQNKNLELLHEVGLIAERDEGRGYYDRFRDRIMFPIRDPQGRTVGFGGRILPESPYASRAPKYYNSADTPLFNKSDLIYGIDLARHAGTTAGYLAVVEGYTDVMMAHQLGIANVVATMGTALNARHVMQLRRYVPRVVLVFDADDGGNTGVDRALEIFVGQDVELSIATLPDGLDPADLLAQPHGKERFLAALNSASDALEFKLQQLLSKNQNPTIETTRRLLDSVLGIMALAPSVPNSASQLKQELMLTRLAQRLGLDLKTVRTRFKELQTNQRRTEKNDRATPRPMPAVGVMSGAARVTNPPGGTGAPPAIERQLLQILLAEPALVAEAREQITCDGISHTGLKRMLLELYALIELGLPADLDSLRVRMIDRPDLVSAAMDLVEVGRGIPDRTLYFRKVIEGFARQKSDAERKAVREQLSGLGVGDEAASLELLRRLQNRSRGVD